MATCLDVITYAMRQSKILAMGDEPTNSEAEDGLVALQSLYDHWRTNGMFGELEDVYLEADDMAEEGRRYYIPDGLTLTDPGSDYIDSLGVTRQPRDLALYETLDSTGNHAAKLYDRTAWVGLLSLELTDTAPLSSRNAYGLAACLATYGGFAANFGGNVDPAIAVLARSFLANIMAKGGSTHDRDGPDFY